MPSRQSHEGTDDGEVPAAHAVANAYLDEWTRNPPDALMLEDMSVLPYSKSDIRDALTEILGGPLGDDRRHELEAAFLALADYRESAGERSGQAGSRMVARWEQERAELSETLQQLRATRKDYSLT